MTEEWKIINGTNGRYLISNNGEVISTNYMNRGYPQKMKPKINNMGYAYYELFINGVSKTFLAHRLVAIHFIENPKEYKIINHKDENPLNNNADNLEWCDYKYNTNYSLNLHPERREKAKTLSTARYRRHTKMLIQMDMNGDTIKTYENVAECARKNNYCSWSIIQCCYGKRKKAYGCKWRFADEQ